MGSANIRLREDKQEADPRSAWTLFTLRGDFLEFEIFMRLVKGIHDFKQLNFTEEPPAQKVFLLKPPGPCVPHQPGTERLPLTPLRG